MKVDNEKQQKLDERQTSASEVNPVPEGYVRCIYDEQDGQTYCQKEDGSWHLMD